MTFMIFQCDTETTSLNCNYGLFVAMSPIKTCSLPDKFPFPEISTNNIRSFSVLRIKANKVDSIFFNFQMEKLNRWFFVVLIFLVSDVLVNGGNNSIFLFLTL